MHDEPAVRRDRHAPRTRPRWGAEGSPARKRVAAYLPTPAAVAVGTLAAGALALAAACADTPTAPARSAAPAAGATVAAQPSRYIAGSNTLLTLVTDSGTLTLDVAASEIRTPQGQRLPLAPDAVAYFRSTWQSIRTTDSIANALSTARPPSTAPCNPRVQNCGPATPLSGRGFTGPGFTGSGLTGGALAAGGFGGFAATSAPLYSTTSLRLEDIPTFSCRDISRTMYDLMPAFRTAKTWFETAQHGMGIAALAQLGSFVVDPTSNRVLGPGEARTIGAISARYSLIVGAANLELATANFNYFKARLGFLGTMFNANQCLTRPWDPDPNLPPPPAAPGPGGGGAGGNGGVIAVCYYRVTSVDGIVISRALWFCRTL